MAATLVVDVWSDIACPWCFIGTRRFAAGVERYRAAGGAREVSVRYHSFELAPDTPVDFAGTEADFLVEHKSLPLPQVRAMLARVSGLAAAEGLHIDFDTVAHTNTGLAHELLQLAGQHGVQEAMAGRLFRAHFSEGRHVGRADELAALAAEVGLDPGLVHAELVAHTQAQAVRDDQELARRHGITSIPFYVIGGRYGVAGAQDPQLFARALAQAAAAVPAGAR